MRSIIQVYVVNNVIYVSDGYRNAEPITPNEAVILADRLDDLRRDGKGTVRPFLGGHVGFVYEGDGQPGG